MGMCCFSLSFLDSFMTGLWREKWHLQSILYHPFHVSVERMTLRSHCLCATVVASFELVEAGLQAFSDPLPVFLLAFYLLHSGETHALSWIRGRRVPSGSTPPFSNHLNHYSSVSVDHFRELVFFFLLFLLFPLIAVEFLKGLPTFEDRALAFHTDRERMKLCCWCAVKRPSFSIKIVKESKVWPCN